MIFRMVVFLGRLDRFIHEGNEGFLCVELVYFLDALSRIALFF